MALAVLSAAVPSPARAGLFTSFAYHEQVSSSQATPNGKQLATSKLDDTTVPLYQSVTATSPGGSMTTSTYDVTDNGATATFAVAVVGRLTGIYQTANGRSDEILHSFPPDRTVFVLSAPVTFVANLSFASTGNSNEIASASVEDPEAISGVVFGLGGDATLARYPQTATGTLQAGVAYQLADYMSIGNTSPGDSTSGTGTSGFTLTPTAVPEPAAAGLAAVAVGMSAGRRRRRSEQ